MTTTRRAVTATVRSEAEGAFTLEGYLLRGPGGRVRILSGRLYLDVEEADLVSVLPLPPPPGLRQDRAVRARVSLRCGARLIAAGDGGPVKGRLFEGPTPFAFAARAADPAHAPSARFLEIEARYIAELEADEEALA